MNDLISRIHSLSGSYFDEILETRRHLHRHPELSFHENKTSAFLSEKLEEIGIQYKSGYAKTGIVGIIVGNDPGKKVVALRADMDALPVQEETEVSWKSKNDGVMHACGHDIHMACLLGAAKILNGLRSDFNGTVLLIFQPGEELLPGGARLMMAEGALSQPEPDVVLGMHVQPDIPAGMVGFRSGKYMASNDEIYLQVKGRGGHAALTQEVADTVLIAAHVLIDLQQIVDTEANGSIPTVLSFGKVIAEGATNVIPDVVQLEGTFRTLNEKWRREAHHKIKSIAHTAARRMGGSCTVEIRQGYPALLNDPELTAGSAELARLFLGKENVLDLDVRMTSEDFAFYAREFPSCFYRLGVGRGKNNAALHTSMFSPDEESVRTGMGLMAFLACSHLK